MSRIFGPLREFFHKGDLLLLSLCLAASGAGLVLIYSATRYLGTNRFVLVQLVGIGIGVVLYVLLSFVDIELLVEKMWKWMFLFNLAIILALIPFGTGDQTTGNKSWIALPLIPLNIQPAEVAKITFILLLAYQCSKLRQRGISRPTSVLQLVAHTGLMCALIGITSSDFGMILIYLLLFVILAWVAGVKLWWFLLALLGAAGGFVALWSHLPRYIQMRVLVVFDHGLDPLDKGWQQGRSILAIGSGGLTGQGFLQGAQTQSAYPEALPARHTDSIFAVCGEEFGLIGCLIIIALLLFIILRCIWVGATARSPMSAFIATGYAGMIMLQTLFNIGVSLYVFPVVGLTLPFISSGGSSIITLFAAMGVVSGIKMRPMPSWLRDRTNFY